jgi:GH24 family phage-related lysozyme (muramidase)
MQQGDSMLRADLDWAIKRAHQLTGLEGNTLLAVGSFIFNSGIGSFVRSTMYRKILKGENIDVEWDKWHTVNGVHSDHIFRFRQYQKKLYNSN